MKIEILKIVLNMAAGILLYISANSVVALESTNELVFLTWSEYLDPEIVEKFELKHNAKLRLVYFETDDTRDDMLLDSQGEGYDLVLIPGSKMYLYQKKKWLAPVTLKQVANIKNVEPKWLNAFEGVKGYAVPYFWGTLGIAYRKDLVGYEITSWKQIMAPLPNLKNKILMIKTTDDVMGMALKSLNYSLNSENPQEYKEVESLLLKQKSSVKDYSSLVLNEDSTLVKGDVYAAMAYSGDALVLKELNSDIEYVLPVEGGGLWVDYIAVMQKSGNKELAYKFLNFLNEAENAAQNAEFVYYPSPNAEAKKLLPREFLDNRMIYPDQKTLDSSEFYGKLPARITKLRNNIFTRVIR
ncbi:MAG: spermidine/putrescine ABC transporter substrate-binding protein [Gammaproteobacteria bacterium]|nr:spermidine/putrescine ABC transporter substrate-binding protein [Gammaproteobacteria bacterium]